MKNLDIDEMIDFVSLDPQKMTKGKREWKRKIISDFFRSNRNDIDKLLKEKPYKTAHGIVSDWVLAEIAKKAPHKNEHKLNFSDFGF